MKELQPISSILEHSLHSRNFVFSQLWICPLRAVSADWRTNGPGHVLAAKKTLHSRNWQRARKDLSRHFGNFFPCNFFFRKRRAQVPSYICSRLLIRYSPSVFSDFFKFLNDSCRRLLPRMTSLTEESCSRISYDDIDLSVKKDISFMISLQPNFFYVTWRRFFIGWLPQGEEEVFRLSGKIASLFHFALQLALLGLLHSLTGNMAFQERNLLCSTAQGGLDFNCQIKLPSDKVRLWLWMNPKPITHRCWKNFLFEATVWKGLPLLSPGLCSTVNPDEIWVISMYLHLWSSFKNSKVAVLSSICTTLIVTLMAYISASQQLRQRLFGFLAWILVHLQMAQCLCPCEHYNNTGLWFV